MLKKWNSLSLVVRIGIGLIIGAILGLTLPGLTWIGVLGKLFVGALKAIAPLLVFVLVSSSLANARGGNMKKFRTARSPLRWQDLTRRRATPRPAAWARSS